MDLEDRLISNILVLMEPVASESNKHVNKEKIHIYNSAKMLCGWEMLETCIGGIVKVSQ